MSGNPWDPTAPMGPVGAKAPPPASPPAGAHWPTPRHPIPSTPSTPEPSTATTPLRQRRRLAALALFLLAPLTMEMLTGATPPMQFVSPSTFITLAALFGSGALIIREVARRHGLGWWSVLLLGAALGTLAGWPLVSGQLDPFWLGDAYAAGYSGALGVNWYWALGMAALCSVIGVALPITLVEAAFPAVAPLPWLRGRWPLVALGALAGAAFIGLFALGFADGSAPSYLLAPAGALSILIVTAALVWLGSYSLGRLMRRAQGAQTIPPTVSQRHAPSLGALRIAGFGFTALFFVAFSRLPQITHRPLLGLAGLALTLAAPALLVRRWSHGLDWSPRRRLALLTGASLFFVALAPLAEYALRPAGRDQTGMTLIAVAALVGLIWLAHAARIAEERRLGQR